jgi:hypothetical protein
VQASFVSRDEPEPLMMAILFFSFASWETLSAIEEKMTSPAIECAKMTVRRHMHK